MAAEKLPFEDAHFDTVLIFGIKEENMEERLGEVRRVLKQQGSLMGRVLGKLSEKKLRLFLSKSGFANTEIVKAGNAYIFRAY